MGLRFGYISSGFMDYQKYNDDTFSCTCHQELGVSFIHVRKSHIWFPLSNISKSIEHNFGDHNRNAKFNFGLYLISYSGVMPLDLPKNTALLQLERAHPCPILPFFFLFFFIYFFVYFLHLQKIALLEEELQKQEYDEDSGTDSPPPGEEHDLPRDGTRQSRGHRRRRLLPSNVSVRQEEVKLFNLLLLFFFYLA